MRGMSHVVLAAAAVAALGGSVKAGFELPLTLRESQGAGGTTYVSNGVPLLPGQAMDVKDLRVVGPDDGMVPVSYTHLRAHET